MVCYLLSFGVAVAVAVGGGVNAGVIGVDDAAVLPLPDEDNDGNGGDCEDCVGGEEEEKDDRRGCDEVTVVSSKTASSSSSSSKKRLLNFFTSRFRILLRSRCFALLDSSTR